MCLSVLSVMKTIPAPARDTACVELTCVAEGAATAKPEALEPCAGGKTGDGHKKVP